MNAERMKIGLLVLAKNLDPGCDGRPIASELGRRLADFAKALANDLPWPEFDNSLFPPAPDSAGKGSDRE